MKKEKFCPQCEQYLPATTEHFYKDKSKKDGLGSWCKECKKGNSKKQDEPKKEETAPATLTETLTELEEKMMKEIPLDNFYEDGLDSIIWTDVFLDEFSAGSKVGRGVLSSLVKKGYISVSEPDTGREGNPTSMGYTELGKQWMEENYKPEQEQEKEETPAPTPQPEPENETEQEQEENEQEQKTEQEETEEEKKCSKCGTYLPRTPEYFYKDKNRKDGLDSWCKTCTKDYHKSKRASKQEEKTEE